MNKISFTNGIEFTPSKVVAVGLNYVKHIEEMKSKAAKAPVLFLKPNSAIHPFTEPLPIPTEFGSVHHEIELAVCISKTCTRVSEEEATESIAGYGVALDLTLRDMQAEAKKDGRPWAAAKGFDHSCPLSTFIPAEQVEEPGNLELKLIVNDEIRQLGSTSHMIYKIPQLIAYASKIFTFEPGDIFITGTPAGVGPLHSGDKIVASIEQIGTFETQVI